MTDKPNNPNKYEKIVENDPDELAQAWRTFQQMKREQEWDKYATDADNVKHLDNLEVWAEKEGIEITQDDVDLAEQELRHTRSDTHPHTPPSILTQIDRTRLKERFQALQEQRKRRAKRAEIAGLLPQYTDEMVEQLLQELEHDWNLRRVEEDTFLSHDFTLYKELWLRYHLEGGMITHRQFMLHSEMSVIEFARTFNARMTHAGSVYVNWHQNWIDQWFHHVRESYAKRADTVKRTTQESLKLYIDGEEVQPKSVNMDTGEVEIESPKPKGTIIATMYEPTDEPTLNPAYFHSEWHSDTLDEDGIYVGDSDDNTDNDDSDDDTIG